MNGEYGIFVHTADVIRADIDERGSMHTSISQDNSHLMPWVLPYVSQLEIQVGSYIAYRKTLSPRLASKLKEVAKLLE